MMPKEVTTEEKWVKASNGYAPANTLVGGYDITGEPIYVARANVQHDLTPGKLVSSKRGALVSWNGEEVLRSDYEVLVDSLGKWKVTHETDIPDNALVGGCTKDGEILYVGRVRYLNSITTGKVKQSEGVCYIPFDGNEMGFKGYEILLKN